MWHKRFVSLVTKTHHFAGVKLVVRKGLESQVGWPSHLWTYHAPWSIILQNPLVPKDLFYAFSSILTILLYQVVVYAHTLLGNPKNQFPSPLNELRVGVERFRWCNYHPSVTFQSQGSFEGAGRFTQTCPAGLARKDRSVLEGRLEHSGSDQFTLGYECCMYLGWNTTQLHSGIVL